MIAKTPNTAKFEANIHRKKQEKPAMMETIAAPLILPIRSEKIPQIGLPTS